MVLVHGVGARASFWKPQIAALGKRFDVIAYDMLGHGESSLPPEEPRLSDYADQLLGLLDHLGIRRAHVIGHSMGGLIAIEFALSHSDRMLSLVAMNAVFCRTSEQRTAVQERVAALDERHTPSDCDSTIARWFGEPVPAAYAAAAATARDFLRTVDPAGYARTYRLFATADAAHRERLATLAAPALFMTAENDQNSSPAMSETMAKLSQRGRALIIPSQRHMMSMTVPNDINRALIDFLDGIEPKGNLQRGKDRAAPFNGIDRISFRKALGSFVTGVTIVATRQADGQPRGFTANSFTSVSLDPPLVLVCISRTAASHGVFVTAPHFSVSILAENQAELSSLFASKASDKFERAEYREGPAGSPIVAGAAAWFDCRTHNVIDGGDHVILIGKVIGFDHTPANPLGYYRGAHVTFGLSLDALATSGNRTQVGAILERDGAIVLVADEDGSLDLPAGSALGDASDPGSLTGRMRALGIEVTLSFLFAVFENPRRGRGAISIYYRGTVENMAAANGGVLLVPFDAIPWPRLRDEAVRSMLRRFVRERSEDTFGIYVGDSEHGMVQTLAPGSPQGLESST